MTASQPQPLPLCSAPDMALLSLQRGQPGLMGHSIRQLEDWVAPHLAQPSDIPGHGEAGSYAHGQHQLNYRLCQAAGTLFQITGETRYAQGAADLLTRYADVYLGLGFQKAKNTNPAGRIFHQILNENMWLLAMSLGYGCVKNTLSQAQRVHIEQQLLRPAVTMMTELYAHDFATIHNHGLWGAAAVGTAGVVMGDEAYLNLALDGLAGDRRTGGFLAQLSLLFAPSGYYIEGPYYHRFALRPLLTFAEVLHTHRPELAIYSYKDGVIGKTIDALLATVYPNGCLPALNDASRSMGIDDEGVLLAAAVSHARYGPDSALQALARQQGQVWVHPAALGLAAATDALTGNALPFWPSVELNEGPLGDKGAQGFLRAQAEDGDITQVCMNYGQHGMDHGHFDTLGITLFNHGDEVLREYGFARWLNVEPKFGGRYLPENASWARQTLAHNSVVVDGQSQNNADRQRADQVHGLPHFFRGTGPVQAMSAFANDHYEGVGMQRTVLLLSHPALSHPLLVDLFRLRSQAEHQYDYAVQYSGQPCDCTAALTQNRSQWSTLGTDNGYQHLMGVAQGPVHQPFKLTWLQGQRFNTWLSAATQGELLMTQLGANDPAFNLRRDSTLILRQRGRDHLFASAFETHGLFDEASERCHGARGVLTQIRVLGHNDEASVVELLGEGLHLTLMVSNRPGVTEHTEHTVSWGGKTYRWCGSMVCEDLTVASGRSS